MKAIADMTREELVSYADKLEKFNAALNARSGLLWNHVSDEKVLGFSDDLALIEDVDKSFTVDDGQQCVPDNVFVKGDNYQALKLLGNDFSGKVDLIYIDPPYNTGNSYFVYDDKYKKGKSGHKDHHSAWLSFMFDRLSVSSVFLKDSGIIMVSIDNNEHSRLRLMMDSIFGEKNFVANIVWQGAGSSLSKHTAGGLDYMLVYAKNISKTQKWRQEKPFAKEMVNLVSGIMDKGLGAVAAESELRKFITKNSSAMDKGLTSYKNVDEQGRIFTSAMITNSLYRPNLKYDIIDPQTGKVFASPNNGWKVKIDVMQKLIDDGLILFGDRKYPRKKLILDDYLYMLPSPYFKADRSQGSKDLDKILGEKIFNFPKNVNVLKKWINSTVGNDALVMDFFAGSGTTGQAVLELNKEDGGNRQFILVTDEGKESGVNIADDIAFSRMRRFMTGQDWADGLNHEMHNGKLKYFSIK